MITPLVNILKQSGCEILFTENDITAIGQKERKKIIVYPAMWVEPNVAGTIYISDSLIKYAMPYAVQKILDSIK